MQTKAISATDARIHLGELMRTAVEQRQPIVVERAGRPHVVIISFEEYRRLRDAKADQPEWMFLLDQAHEQIKTELGDRKLIPPEEIIRQMREERDAELVSLH